MRWPSIVVSKRFSTCFFILGLLLIAFCIFTGNRSKAKDLKQERELLWSIAYDRGFIDGMHATLKHAPILKGSELDLAPIMQESQSSARYKEKH